MRRDCVRKAIARGIINKDMAPQMRKKGNETE